MIAFLSTVAAKIVEDLLARVYAFFAALTAQILRRKKIEDDAKESVKPLKNAQTGEEIDKASDGALDRW